MDGFIALVARLFPNVAAVGHDRDDRIVRHLSRSLVLASALLATTSVWAQTAYNPTVAYTSVAGKTTYLYLANADGSHAVSVASSSTGITGIDFTPGGGRIAFSDKRVGLKVLGYTASNSGITLNGSVQLLDPGSTSGPDFSSDGSRILYYKAATQTAPGGIYGIASAGGTPVFLYPGSGVISQRWLRPATNGNAFAFLKLSGQYVYEIWTVQLDGNDQALGSGVVLSTATQVFKGIEDFDTARTRDALLITADYPTTNRVVEFNLQSRALIDVAGPTFRVHYSADDSRIVSTDLPHLGSKEYVTSLDLATGFITRLSGAGNFGAVDARP